MKTKVKSEKLLSDLEFIKFCGGWPCWPYLPIKRGEHYPEDCMLLWAGNWSDDNTPRFPLAVYNCNLWSLPKTVEEFKAKKFKEYESVEALLADGWVVD